MDRHAPRVQDAYITHMVFLGLLKIRSHMVFHSTKVHAQLWFVARAFDGSVQPLTSPRLFHGMFFYQIWCLHPYWWSPSSLMPIDSYCSWWVGIILSWSISSTNDDSDPKLGTVSHYFPLAWDHDSKWMYCFVFALTGGWEYQLSGMLNARGHPLVNFNMFHKDYTISWPSRTIFRRGLEFLSYTCGDVFESRSSCFSQLLFMCSFQGPLSR